jgi:hypothetical protein
MRPYWIVTEPRLYPGTHSGVGITARSESDAREIYAQVFDDYILVSIEPVVDMRDLDQNHVVPNMGNWFVRGVWYPRGDETPISG